MNLLRRYLKMRNFLITIYKDNKQIDQYEKQEINIHIIQFHADLIRNIGYKVIVIEIK
jgi:hypothetical protein